MARVAVVGGGPRGLRRVPDAAARRARPGGDRRLRDRRTGPGRGVAAARGGDPAARDALGERRALPADVVPGARRARGAPPAARSAARAQRLRPLPPDRARTSSSTSRRCACGAAGTGASRAGAVERIRAVDGGFELDGHGVVRARAPRDRPPRPARRRSCADDPRAVHAYEPHEYAATVSVVGAGLAAATEWLNALAAGRGGGLGAAARAGAAAAERAAAVLLAPRARVVPPARPPERARDALRALLAPSYPPGPAWDEPLARAAEGRFRVEAAVNGAEQVICATGFLRGYRHDPLLAPPRRGARARDRRRLDRARPRLDACPRSPTRRATLALAGVAAQWAFPAADTLVGARYAAHGFLAGSMSYTLRGRLESRLAALLPVCRRVRPRRRHRWWPVELVA